MTTITVAPAPLGEAAVTAPARGGRFSAYTTLARRRFALSARTPREVIVPLLTPVLFANVIAPALAKSVHSPGVDYVSYVAVGTIGLLVPLSCVLGGVGMIVDRESGAQRDLLAAPVPRALMVLGNLTVSVALSAFQVIVLIAAAVARGATFATAVSGIAWAAGAALGIAVAMHAVAEVLAARIAKQEEYVGTAPPVALVPWFFAGSFFRITAMPRALAWFARMLPLTHALALLRYGLVDHTGKGLKDIWGMTNTTAMAALSLAVVAAFAIGMLLLSVRVFTRAAIR
ncbi:MAG TPA: ABC transporter permease [Acidimicrobiales bacterium]|nr:ABC transporter permease [Acidimicrobiales bacterium]